MFIQKAKLLSKLGCRYFCTANLAEPVLELKHHYGQNGLLKTSFTKSEIDIKIKTIWEDYALLSFYGAANPKELTYSEDASEQMFFLSDENATRSLPVDKLIADITEYYNIDLTTLGSVEYEKSDVSSKTIGNVRVAVPNNGKIIKLSKVKSENTEILTANSKIQIDSYLEAYLMKLETRGDLVAKRIGISGHANIRNLNGGEFKISSIYTGLGQKHEALLKGTTEKGQSYQENLKNHITNLSSWLHFESQGGNVVINNHQGPLLMDLEDANVLIERLSASNFVIQGRDSKANIHIYSMQGDGIINLANSELRLSVEENLPINIFFSEEAEFFEGTADSNRPTLHLTNKKLMTSFSRQKSKYSFTFGARERPRP